MLQYFTRNSHQYSALPKLLDIEARDRKSESRLKSLILSKIFLFIIVCIIAVIAMGLLIATSNWARYALSSDEILSNGFPCGNSSTEAISNGCTFDQLTWSWYPPKCPHYANREYLNAEEWTWYIDPAGTQIAKGANWTSAMDNKFHLYGEKREHLTHCVYLLLSVGQVLRDRTPFPQKIVDYSHLAHCADFILENLRRIPDWHSMNTEAPFVDYSVTC